MNNSLYNPALFSKLIVVAGVWVFLLFFGAVQAIAGNTIRIPSISGFDDSDNLSQRPSISTDGGFVAFESSATNLINSDTNGFDDVFINDLNANLNQRASVDSGGFEALENSRLVDVNEDGTLVVFSSFAQLTPQDTNNEEDVYVRDIVNATTTLVSISIFATAGNRDSLNASISGDGSYVAFQSDADDLVANDFNGVTDVFLHELSTGITTRVSTDSAGLEAVGGNSGAPSLNHDGQVIAFSSYATNLIPADTNGLSDVFVHELSSGLTTLVSANLSGNVGSGFSQIPSISDDGTLVAFESSASDLVNSDGNFATDVFVRDLNGGSTTRVSVDDMGTEGNDGSNSASISGDGLFVAFASQADNLIGADNNGVRDVFVHEIAVAETSRVSVDSAGTEATAMSGVPAISGDGNLIVFISDAIDLVQNDTNGLRDIFVHDRSTGETVLVSVSNTTVAAETDGISANPSTSRNGRYTAFNSYATNVIANDINGDTSDVFVYDKITQLTTLVSVDSAGIQKNCQSRNPSINGSGRYVAFDSACSLDPLDIINQSDIYVHDRNSGQTMLVSVDNAGLQSNGASDTPAISANGRYVAFKTYAALDPADNNGTNDIYVRDLLLNTTSWASANIAGVGGNGTVWHPSVSSTGYVAFPSTSSDLLAAGVDLNASTDVFVYRPGLATIRVSVDSFGAEGNGNSSEASISANGNFVAFSSIASNLDPTDTTPAGWDVLVHDINLSTTAIVSSDGAGVQLDNAREPSINGNGRVIAFQAETYDIFVKRINGPMFLQASVDSTGIVGNDSSFNPSLSLNGRVVSFHSVATNLDVLVPDTNGETDVFLHRN